MSAILDAPWIESDETASVPEALPAPIYTTLFALISALQDAAGPDDDATVVAAVDDLLQTGHIRFLDHGAVDGQ